jgi:hypothetical protein
LRRWKDERLITGVKTATGNRFEFQYAGHLDSSFNEETTRENNKRRQNEEAASRSGKMIWTKNLNQQEPLFHFAVPALYFQTFKSLTEEWVELSVEIAKLRKKAEKKNSKKASS